MAIVYNDYIKRPGMEDEYTPDQIQELVKCSNDPEYFLANYVKVMHPDKGPIPFQLYSYQKRMCDAFDKNRLVIAKIFRQGGKTAFCAGFLLWYNMFHSNKTSGIVSNKATSANEVLDRIKIMYETVPSWMKPGVENYAKTTITFENGSRIIAAATSKNSFRGWTINGTLLCDEFAHVPHNLQQEFWSSNYPTISSSKHAKLIIISTPLGIGDLFHELYTKSEKRENKFVNIKADWWEHPERTQEWADGMKETLGDVLYSQEILCEFISSSVSVVINIETVKKLLNCWKYPIQTDMKGFLRIYEKPKPNEQYIFGVDVAVGTGEHYSTIQILKIDSIQPIKLTQVAVFESNKVDPYQFAEIINKLYYYYNNAYILVENNSIGAAVVTQLHWEYENEGLINSGSKLSKLGIRATKTTKPRAVMLMKKLIEDNCITINDKRTILQLTDFQDKGNNRYSCLNMDDDLISALYWACYIFEMDVLEESIKFKENDEDDGWGIIFGSNDENEGEILQRW